MPEQRVRKVRVFVLSTFRDMQAERDELIKRVFPALRHLCEARNVAWGEIDLRWGLTEEQKEANEILPICLDVIDRCRPYFIGLLGDRYGWTPNSLPLGLTEQHVWAAALAGKSITELEILHGVLNAPDRAAGAFFYLRSPAFLDRLPAEERGLYVEPPGEGARKLAALKQRIRQSGLPVHENYNDAAELGAAVLADFTALIDRLYPEEETRDPLAEEAQRQAAFARASARGHVGRAAELAALDADPSGEPIAVVGAAGIGKTALLAHLAELVRSRAPSPLVLEHYVGATPTSTDWAAMLRRLIGELDRSLSIGLPIPDESDALKLAFADALRIAAERTPILLAIDAVDRLAPGDGALELAWLPLRLPPRLRLFLSATTGPTLAEIARRGWRTLEIAPLAREERAALLADRLATYNKALSPAQAEAIGAAPATGNPLFLCALAEELRIWGDHFTLDERVAHYLAATDPVDLYERILARYEADYERERPDLVREAMSLLHAARFGLSETELRDLLGRNGEPLPHAPWATLQLAAEGSLINRSGLIGFGQGTMREAVARRYLREDGVRRGVHRRLADYFTARPQGPRRIEELPWQLERLEAWDELATLMSDLDFLADAMVAAHYDVRHTWREIEARSPYRLLDAHRPLLRRPAAYLGSQRGVAALAQLLIHVGHGEAALTLEQHLAQVARAAGDKAGLQTSLANQAFVFRQRGDLDGAAALFAESEALAQATGRPLERASMLGARAVILAQRGRHTEAAALFEEQERVCREAGDRRGEAIARNNRGVSLRAQGDHAGALELASQAAQTSRRRDDKDALGLGLGNQAVALMAQGRYDEAEPLLAEQERLARDTNDKPSLQICLGNLASIRTARGRDDEALSLLAEREALCRELGAKEGLCMTLGDQALIHRLRGQVDRALSLHQEEVRLCREMDLPALLQKSLHNQAAVHLSRGDPQRAGAMLREQEAICRRIGDRVGLHHSLGMQATIARLAGDLANAWRLLQEKEGLCRETGDRRGLQDALGQQAVVLLSSGSPTDPSQAEARLQEQESVCRELGLQADLQTCLGNRASALARCGDFAGALRAHAEEEEICRALDARDALQVSLGNQANIYAAQKQFDRAHEKFIEQERICRSIGAPYGLVAALTNHAMMLAQDLSRPKDALPLMEEAYRLADRPGLENLRREITPAFDYVRQGAAR